MDIDLLLPQDRADQIGRASVEARLRAAMGEGVLSHGWIIAGPSGVGKATLAYRVARGLLDPAALADAHSFDVSPQARVFHLVAAGAHPDLFVAERLWDDKKGKRQAEITVETVRRLTAFLSRTASGGGARVAIVDTADDMNRNAANALLKVLEEPPANTLLLLLSSAPGRLLATIRSRCRRIDLPAVEDEAVLALLSEAGVEAGEAGTLAAAARGRPGYALRLAADDGAAAIRMADRFLAAAATGGDIGTYVSVLTGKGAEARWDIFKETLVARLSDAARDAALSGAGEETGGAGGRAKGAAALPASPAGCLAAWETATGLIARGEGLNLDRGQLIFALAQDIRAALRSEAA